MMKENWYLTKEVETLLKDFARNHTKEQMFCYHLYEMLDMVAKNIRQGVEIDTEEILDNIATLMTDFEVLEEYGAEAEDFRIE
jgi:hypothetical protein